MKCQTQPCPNEGQEHFVDLVAPDRGSVQMFLCPFHAIDFGLRVDDEEFLLAEIAMCEMLADKHFAEMKRQELRIKTLQIELDLLRRRKK